MTKVLIVDDEEPVRDAVKILGDWDRAKIVNIYEAVNGKMGLELQEIYKPDIVFVDMKMPEMDGVEYLRIAENKYPDAVYIVISGYDNFEFTRQAIKSRVIDYLLKPINKSELNNALDKALEVIKSKKQSRANLLGTSDAVLCSQFVEEQYERTYILSLKEQLRNSLPNESLECSHNIIKKYISDCRKRKYFPRQDANRSINEFFYVLNDIAIDSGVPINYLPSEETFQDEILKFDDYEKLIYSMVTHYYEMIRKYLRSFDNFDIRTVKEYIDNRYHEQIKLSTFTEKYYMSREYLLKKFKCQYGCGIHEYILQVRMLRAKELLNDTNVKIQAISQMLGYSDSNYFSKAFKNYYGISPTEYRDSSKD